MVTHDPRCSYGPATSANAFYAVITTVDPTQLQDVVALCADAARAFYHAERA